jgi:alcohol dehydrogenase YqhD (iron-dependent ADH family)
MIKGLNLYQFEKLNYFTFDENKWYNITEEAKECYTAYFEALGIKKELANEQIRAFELLQVLRTNSYKRSFFLDNEVILRGQIDKIMNQEKFI